MNFHVRKVLAAIMSTIIRIINNLNIYATKDKCELGEVCNRSFP
jgi:hypothetical protein